MELPTNPGLPTNPYVTRNLLPTELTNISFFRFMYNISTIRTYLRKLGYWISIVNTIFEHNLIHSKLINHVISLLLKNGNVKYI